MLPEKVMRFLNENSSKPISHLIKSDPDFAIEFVRAMSWNEKFELIGEFIENPKIKESAELIDSQIADFLLQELEKHFVNNISEEEYLRCKAICESYENQEKNDN